MHVADNLSDAGTTLAQQRAELKATDNAAHRISTPVLTSAVERSYWTHISLGQVAKREISLPQVISVEPRSSRPQSTDFSRLSGSPAFRSPRPGGSAPSIPSPAISDIWASMVNTPFLPLFQKLSTANNNPTSHGQTVDLAGAESSDLCDGGGGNVPRLNGPEKIRWPSKCQMHDGSSGSTNNGVTDDGVYGEDGDLISSQLAPGVGRTQYTSSSGGGLLRGGGMRSIAQALHS